MRSRMRTIVIGSTSVSSARRTWLVPSFFELHERLALRERQRDGRRALFEAQHVAAAQVLEKEAEVLETIHADARSGAG